MQALTTTQRQYLRRLAHELRPIVQVGKQGVTDQVRVSVEQALAGNELIKVKFMDFRDQKRELAEDLAATTNSVLIGVIGNIVMLYREHPDPEKRKIALPTS